MPLINNPDLGIRLKEFLQLVDLPDSILGPEIVAVVQVADLSAGGGGRAAMGVCDVEAVVGQRSVASLASPVVEGTLRTRIKVTGCDISSFTTGVYQLRVSSAAFTPDAVSTARSWQNLNFVGPPSAELGNDNRTGAAFPASTTIWQGVILADTIKHITLDLSLGDRTVKNLLFVNSVSDNVALDVGWFWTEFV